MSLLACPLCRDCENGVGVIRLSEGRLHGASPRPQRLERDFGSCLGEDCSPDSKIGGGIFNRMCRVFKSNGYKRNKDVKLRTFEETNHKARIRNHTSRNHTCINQTRKNQTSRNQTSRNHTSHTSKNHTSRNHTRINHTRKKTHQQQARQ
jgi:hypothetical protein